MVAPRGSEASFAGAEDVVAKFTKLAGRRMPADRIARIMDWVLNAERATDAASLVGLLSAPAGAGA